MDASLMANLGGWTQAYEIVRGIFIFLDGVLLIVFLFSFVKAWPFRPKIRPEHGEYKKTYTLEDAALKERWASVIKKTATDSPDSLKLAIIEADKVVDDALKQLGLEGEHMADRLEQLSGDEVRTLSHLWRAHRVRNNLVHTPGFELSKEHAMMVIKDYELFLKEIKLLA